jgi:hypothetical protein
MRRPAITVLLCVGVLGATGCEPRWSYRPAQPGPARTGDYEIDGATARVLTGALDVRFTLRNVGLVPLSVDPERFRVLDARGRELPRDRAASTEHVVYKVLRGTSLDLGGAFQVERGRWPFFNRALRTITITVDVMGGAGAQVLQTSLDRT